MVKYDVVLIDSKTCEDMPVFVLDATKPHPQNLDHDGMKDFLESQGVGVGDNLIRSVTLHKGGYVYFASATNSGGSETVSGLIKLHKPVSEYDYALDEVLKIFNSSRPGTMSLFMQVTALSYLHREFNQQ